jgi:hypothetical protein
MKTAVVGVASAFLLALGVSSVAAIWLPQSWTEGIALAVAGATMTGIGAWAAARRRTRLAHGVVKPVPASEERATA